MSSGTFMYFAYGSNLLKKRIHINNPTAEFIGIGRLDDHQLNFIKYSDNWEGSSATIVPTEGCNDVDWNYVWGAVWRLSNQDMPALDRQEGVETNWYFPKTVSVTMPTGDVIPCRTYQQSENPPVACGQWTIPLDRRPSITYLDCILDGAVECGLPEEYIQRLKNIPHNDKVAPLMVAKLKSMNEL